MVIILIPSSIKTVIRFPSESIPTLEVNSYQPPKCTIAGQKTFFFGRSPKVLGNYVTPMLSIFRFTFRANTASWRIMPESSGFLHLFCTAIESSNAVKYSAIVFTSG